jgi:hypothetical protein
MGRPTVWIVNKGNHPTFDTAEKFGDIKILTEGRVNIFSIDNLQQEIETKLEEGGASSDDLVLVSGYNIPNMIAGNWFMERFGFCRLLVWGANRQKYMILTWNKRKRE